MEIFFRNMYTNFVATLYRTHTLTQMCSTESDNFADREAHTILLPSDLLLLAYPSQCTCSHMWSETRLGKCPLPYRRKWNRSAIKPVHKVINYTQLSAASFPQEEYLLNTCEDIQFRYENIYTQGKGLQEDENNYMMRIFVIFALHLILLGKCKVVPVLNQVPRQEDVSCS
jgi:hypothetical protein